MCVCVCVHVSGEARVEEGQEVMSEEKTPHNVMLNNVVIINCVIVTGAATGCDILIKATIRWGGASGCHFKGGTINTGCGVHQSALHLSAASGVKTSHANSDLM